MSEIPTVDVRVHEPTEEPGPRRRPALRFGSLFVIGVLGVILPTVAIVVEATRHFCASIFFDPLPSWWNVLLVATVPLANSAVLLTLFGLGRPNIVKLLHFNALAIGVSAVYAAIFLPMSPAAVFGVAWYGIGLLPLAPLFGLFAALLGRRELRLFAGKDLSLASWFPGFAAGVLALTLPHAHGFVTDQLLDLARSEDPARSRRGVTLLRTFGSRDALLSSCYQQMGSMTLSALFGTSDRRNSEADLQQARQLFYRVTGRPFNSVPAPRSATARGFGAVGSLSLDSGVGGMRVADKVAGLSLDTSRLDARVDAVANVSYVEWTMIFKNVAANDNEARAQIELPPGGVVSRLTLWIDGEPREAAFGGRAQVRAAYQEIAVVQRRDPVLVTTAGPGRVLMQCFPVPSNGEMKVRVGITAPLRMTSEDRRAARMPRFLETNFDQKEAFTHDLWLESDSAIVGGAGKGGSVVREAITDRALKQRGAYTLQAQASAETLASDPTDPAFYVRQTVRCEERALPTRIAIVIDGSAALAPYLETVAHSLSTTPFSSQQVAVFFAGDELQRGPESGDLPRWVTKRKAVGGRDNLPAIVAAWDFAAEETEGAILWIRGPQPVLLSSAEPLIQRSEREKYGPTIHDLPVEAGPNRLIEALDRYPKWKAADLEGTFSESLKLLMTRLTSKSAGEFVFVRERISKETRPMPEAELTSAHVARLWGAEEVERLRTASVPGSLDRAIKLALQLQLVTPVSGAVVLERKEQYERHGLEPADPATAPSVPEPSAAVLLALGAAWWAARRDRPRNTQSE